MMFLLRSTCACIIFIALLGLLSCASVPTTGKIDVMLASDHLTEAEEYVASRGGYEANPELTAKLARAYREHGQPDVADSLLERVRVPLEDSLQNALEKGDEPWICYYAGLLGRGDTHCEQMIQEYVSTDPEKALKLAELAGLQDHAYEAVLVPAVVAQEDAELNARDVRRLWKQAGIIGRCRRLLEDLRGSHSSPDDIELLMELAEEIDIGEETAWYYARTLPARREAEALALAEEAGKTVELRVIMALQQYASRRPKARAAEAHIAEADAIDEAKTTELAVDLGIERLRGDELSYEAKKSLSGFVLQRSASTESAAETAYELTQIIGAETPEIALAFAAAAGERSEEAFSYIAEKGLDAPPYKIRAVLTAAERSNDPELLARVEARYPYALIEIAGSADHVAEIIEIAETRNDGTRIARAICRKFGPDSESLRQTDGDELADQVLRAARIAGNQDGFLNDCIRHWKTALRRGCWDLYRMFAENPEVNAANLANMVYEQHKRLFVERGRPNQDQMERTFEFVQEFGRQEDVERAAMYIVDVLLSYNYHSSAEEFAEMVGRGDWFRHKVFMERLDQRISNAFRNEYTTDGRKRAAEEIYEDSVAANATTETAERLARTLQKKEEYALAETYAERAGNEGLLEEVTAEKHAQEFQRIREEVEKKMRSAYRYSADEEDFERVMAAAETVGKTRETGLHFLELAAKCGKLTDAEYFLLYAGEEGQATLAQYVRRKVEAEISDLMQKGGRTFGDGEKYVDQIRELAATSDISNDAKERIILYFAREDEWPAATEFIGDNPEAVSADVVDGLLMTIRGPRTSFELNEDTAATVLGWTAAAGIPAAEGARKVAETAEAVGALTTAIRYYRKAGDQEEADNLVMSAVEQIIRSDSLETALIFAKEQGVPDVIEYVEGQLEIAIVWRVVGPITQQYVEGDLDKATYHEKFRSAVLEEKLVPDDIELLVQYYLETAMHAKGGGYERAARANQKAADALVEATEAAQDELARNRYNALNAP